MNRMKSFLFRAYPGFLIVSILAIGQSYAQDAPVPGTGSLQLEIATPHQFTTVHLDSDSFTGRFDLNVALADIGKMAGLFMAAEYQQQWYLRTPVGWDTWDQSSESLHPFVTVALSSQTSFELFEEQTLLAGDYTIYTGYRVTGEELTVSSTIMHFTVQSSKVDTLHRFISDEAMASYLKQGMQSSSSDQVQFATLEMIASASADSNGVAGGATRVSSTNVQEVGVDEADVIKTDGEHIFVLRNCGNENCIASFALDAVNAEAQEVGLYTPQSEEAIDFQTADSMYLIQNRPQGDDMIVTLSGANRSIPWLDIWGWSGNQVELEFINASDPANLSLQEKLTIDGSLVSSRRLGDSLYLVSRYTPFIEGYTSYAFDEITKRENELLLTEATLSSLVPKVKMLDKIPLDLIESQNCFMATSAVDINRNPTIITITTIPLSDPSAFASTCYLGNSETVYMTPQSLFLATTQNQYTVLALDALVYDPEHKTAVHKFSIADNAVTYRGSGEVRGHLGWSEDKRSFRMGARGEDDEYLNVVTSIGGTWGSTSSTRLTVLKNNGNQLDTVAFIDGIGKPGEQLYAARFVENRAYLVTFRVVDPLYVIDLSDQDNPKIAGELEIEGYSDYLHPLSDNLLLGFGKDAIADDDSSDFGFTRGAWYQGVKVSLFNVADPEFPSEINSLIYGKRGSESEILYDHHAISFLPATDSRKARFAIPIQIHATTPGSQGFDPSAPNAWYSFTSKGLYSFEVDAAGVTEVGVIEADSTENIVQFGFFGSFGDRSVLVDDAVFYVHQGEVLGSAWESK